VASTGALGASSIAWEAQRDGSAMITIAVVTMIFLPGTFVCVRPILQPLYANTHL